MHDTMQGILLPGLSGRKKCVNYAKYHRKKHENAKDAWGVWGVWVTPGPQPNLQVNGKIRYTTILLDCWVDYGYSSSRRGNRPMLLCFSCRQKASSLSSRFIV